MKKMLKRRSGFTLVELLIVIIIIGILAGAMLMLVGSGSDRAEATKIISDLRSLKAAALMHYADNGQAPAGTNSVNLLSDYMDKELDETSGDYTFIAAEGQWFVGRLNLDDMAEGVRDALDKNKESAGLLADATSADIATNYYDGGADTFMRAR